MGMASSSVCLQLVQWHLPSQNPIANIELVACMCSQNATLPRQCSESGKLLLITVVGLAAVVCLSDRRLQCTLGWTLRSMDVSSQQLFHSHEFSNCRLAFLELGGLLLALHLRAWQFLSRLFWHFASTASCSRACHIVHFVLRWRYITGSIALPVVASVD